jgi:hypothetical protein
MEECRRGWIVVIVQDARNGLLHGNMMDPYIDCVYVRTLSFSRQAMEVCLHCRVEAVSS